RMTQVDPQLPADAGQVLGRKRRSIVHVQHFRNAAAQDRFLQAIFQPRQLLVEVKLGMQDIPAVIVENEAQDRLSPFLRVPRVRQVDEMLEVRLYQNQNILRFE